MPQNLLATGDRRPVEQGATWLDSFERPLALFDESVHKSHAIEWRLATGAWNKDFHARLEWATVFVVFRKQNLVELTVVSIERVRHSDSNAFEHSMCSSEFMTAVST